MALLKIFTESHNTHKSCEGVRDVTYTGYENVYVCELGGKVTRLTIKWRDTTHAKDYFCHEINILPSNRERGCELATALAKGCVL